MTKIIPPSDYPRLHAIVAEYLPGTEAAALDKMCADNPFAMVGYYHENECHKSELIGVCYGGAGKDGDFSLDGIAIVHPHNAQGWGGELLAFFEAQVAALGYTSVSLGSADGYVERFYLKNGYTPTELKMYVTADCDPSSAKDASLPVSYTQPEGSRLKLVFSVDNYHEIDKASLCKHYNGSDAFYVFVKKLK
ncbi:MAG: hypothetical protein FWC71_00020 [Defluviitaleaceae bacterium]|nr:hypothetical protein [Defluviitaleaceae bacterium]